MRILGINSEQCRYDYSFKGKLAESTYMYINSCTNDKLLQIAKSATDRNMLVNEELLQETVNKRNRVIKKLEQYMKPFSDNIELIIKEYDYNPRKEFRFIHNLMAIENAIYSPNSIFGDGLTGLLNAAKTLMNIPARQRQKDMLNEFVQRSKKLANESSEYTFQYVDAIDDMAKITGPRRFLKENFEPYLKSVKNRAERKQAKEKKNVQFTRMKNQEIVGKYLLYG